MSATAIEPVVDRVFVLPDDVLFVPAMQLAPHVREALGDAEGHLAVTRPGFRVPARLVDEATAALLHEFRPGDTIAAAIARFCGQRGLEAEETLDAAFPMLQLFVASRVLVVAGSPEASGAPASLAPGQRWRDLEIVASLQITLDTEVYRARTAQGVDVALKLERIGAPAATRDAFEREADVLRRWPDRLVPRLLAAGEDSGRRYLVLSWIDGVPITVRAAQIRQQATPGWRERLHALVCRVADAFARLHAAGVVHGDVHPHNILAGVGDAVFVIDFGMSTQPGRGAPLEHSGRTGLGWYLDPAAVRCLLDGEMPPPPDPGSEGYALAALLYQTITGRHYLAFSPEADVAYAQVLHEAPLPFTRHGIESWPAVEAVLHRAFARDRAERHASMAAFAAALRGALPPSPHACADAEDERAESFVSRFVPLPTDPVPPLRALFVDAPRVAADRGAVGLAWFYYRVALLRDRPDLLALADVWIERAHAELHASDAFHTPACDVADFRIDDCSVLHRAPGVHFVRALIALARCAQDTAAEAIAAFLASSSTRAASTLADVTLGRAGVLLAATTLWQASAATSRIDRGALTASIEADHRWLSAFVTDAGDATRDGDERTATGGPRLVDRQPLSLAHGWVGILYALLRATSVLQHRQPLPLSQPFCARLEQVIDALHRVADAPTESTIPGWCNGSAGQIPFLTCASDVLGEPRFLALARRLGKHTAEHRDRHQHLCCGVAGRVFALLHLHRHTGDAQPLWRARELARHLSAAPPEDDTASRQHSLFWGPLGAALALEELRHPESAAMPMFGDLGFALP